MDCIKPTDRSTQAVLAALAEAAATGRTLYLPGGDTYEIDQPLEVVATAATPRATSIVGDGPGRTVLRSHVAGSLIRLRSSVPGSHQGWHSAIGGLEITGDGTDPQQSGIDIRDMWLGSVRDCYVHDLKGDGIALRAECVDIAVPKLCTIERCTIWRCGGAGVRLGRVGEIVAMPARCTVDACDIQLCEDAGIFAESDALRVSRSIIASCGSATGHGGLWLSGVPGYVAFAALIDGVSFERNWPTHLTIDRYSSVRVVASAFARLTSAERSIIELGSAYLANVEIAQCMLRSAVPGVPVCTAIVGGAGLKSIRLRDVTWNLSAGHTRYSFAPTTKLAIEEL